MEEDGNEDDDDTSGGGGPRQQLRAIGGREDDGTSDDGAVAVAALPPGGRRQQQLPPAPAKTRPPTSSRSTTMIDLNAHCGGGGGGGDRGGDGPNAWENPGLSGMNRLPPHSRNIRKMARDYHDYLLHLRHCHDPEETRRRREDRRHPAGPMPCVCLDSPGAIPHCVVGGGYANIVVEDPGGQGWHPEVPRHGGKKQRWNADDGGDDNEAPSPPPPQPPPIDDELEREIRRLAEEGMARELARRL